ncbi:MAG: glycosyltransferase family 2 protein, partial [Candidatus Paceibacteria bacterium]
MANVDVSVVVMTLNEEENIEYCLGSVEGWSSDIHVVDSKSTDNTVELAKRYAHQVHTMRDDLIGSYEYANMRNWVINTIDFENEWVLFLDADEQLTEDLRKEIPNKIQDSEENGFYIYRRFIFLDKWLRHGRNYTKEIRLYKYNECEYIEQGAMDYVKVNGEVGTLQSDLIHNDRKPFSDWVAKHDSTAKREAQKLLSTEGLGLALEEENTHIEGGKRHWMINNIWSKIPLYIRPFILFTYVYIIRLGILDGLRGFLYYIHHDFWYYFLIYT